MAHVQFDQPVFDWDAKDLYKEYQRFKQHVDFVFKGPLARADAKHKTGWIGLWIGKQGREIYKTFEWGEGEQDNPDVTLNKLEDYVRPRKNKRVARYRLKQRKQTEGESFDNFVKDVRLILMDCDYADPDDTLIDGVLNRKVQEKMFDQGQNITLAKCLDIGRQFEMSQKQLKMIRGEESVNSVQVKYKTKRSVRHSENKPKQTQKFTRRRKSEAGKHKKTHFNNELCTRCGREAHKNGVCPALGSTCNYCHKPDHWKVKCRKRLNSEQYAHVNALQRSADSETNSDSDGELFPIYSHQRCDNNISLDDKWLVQMTVSNKPMQFRIDTGARCCILVKSQYDKLGASGKVQQSTKVLKSVGVKFRIPELSELSELGQKRLKIRG